MSDKEPLPTWLRVPRTLADDEIARAEWRRLAPVLWELGIIDPLGALLLLPLYCMEYSIWKHAQAEITNLGELIELEGGAYQVNPCVEVAAENKAGALETLSMIAGPVLAGELLEGAGKTEELQR